MRGGEVLVNPFRGVGLSDWAGGEVCAEVAPVLELLGRCPVAGETPLLVADDVARRVGVRWVGLKDESRRMGLGSFKALGAAFVIAADAVAAVAGRGGDAVRELADEEGRRRALDGRRYVCASAGNHGLSVAAGARVFGARAEVFLAEGVSEVFAERLRSMGAVVTRAGKDYEESMGAARVAAAGDEGAVLLSDSSWPGYVELPARVMQGYLAMAAEAVGQLVAPPDFVFLQAGVGGMAAAVAAYVRRVYGDAPVVVVAEPARAPALLGSVAAGAPVTAEGGESCMGRLDCKAPSYLALAALARSADFFVTIEEEESVEAVAVLAPHVRTTPSGAAGVAAAVFRGVEVGVGRGDSVLCFVTEGRAA